MILNHVPSFDHLPHVLFKVSSRGKSRDALRRRSPQEFEVNPMKVYIFWKLKRRRIRQNVNLKRGTNFSQGMRSFLTKLPSLLNEITYTRILWKVGTTLYPLPKGWPKKLSPIFYFPFRSKVIDLFIFIFKKIYTFMGFAQKYWALRLRKSITWFIPGWYLKVCMHHHYDFAYRYIFTHFCGDTIQ